MSSSCPAGAPGDVFHTEEGAAVMSYWGKLCGNLYGTIVVIQKLENGDYYIETNYPMEDHPTLLVRGFIRP